MNKKPAYMEKMIALVMLAYSIGVVTGEGVRDAVYGKRIDDPAQVLPTEHIPNQPQLRQSQKWKQYSGLFILLRQNLALPLKQRRKIYRQVLPVFTRLTQCPVRTHVRTSVATIRHDKEKWWQSLNQLQNGK